MHPPTTSAASEAANRSRTSSTVTEPRTWIAVGDSFTFGTGDDPDHHGWVSRTAETLVEIGHITTFHNLAQPGLRLQDVLRDQTGQVTEPVHLVSAIAGANDLFQPRCDIAAVLAQMDQLLNWASTVARFVLTTTCPDFTVNRRGSLRRLSTRIDRVNDHVERRHRQTGSRLVVVDAHRILADPALWADDGVHAGPDGHLALAQAAATQLGEALA